MNIRRLVLLSIASLGLVMTQFAPVFTAASLSKGTEIRLADGDFPPPEECGLYDICKVEAES